MKLGFAWSKLSLDVLGEGEEECGDGDGSQDRPVETSPRTAGTFVVESLGIGAALRWPRAAAEEAMGWWKCSRGQVCWFWGALL